MKKSYYENESLTILLNRGLKIDKDANNVFIIPDGAFGIKLWGRIEFLKTRGYKFKSETAKLHAIDNAIFRTGQLVKKWIARHAN